MKTLILHITHGDMERPKFFLVDGDHRKLDDLVINADETADTEPLFNLLYDEEGDFKLPHLNEPPKDGWDYFIVTGFML